MIILTVELKSSAPPLRPFHSKRVKIEGKKKKGQSASISDLCALTIKTQGCWWNQRKSQTIDCDYEEKS